MKYDKRILCIGAGYVGGPTMAVIASKCPNYRVTVVDVDQGRVDAWNSGKPPIYEPGLDEVVRQGLGRNLFFTTDIARGIRENDIIFVSVNTPTKTFGAGAGLAADLQYWEKRPGRSSSTPSPPRSSSRRAPSPSRRPRPWSGSSCRETTGSTSTSLSNPEFLAEGTAIRDLVNPDRVLIGSRDTHGAGSQGPR